MAETFDPQMIKLQGKDYLEVAQRVLWLRKDHPDAQIITDITYHDPGEGFVLVRAIVTIPNGGTATGHGTAKRGGRGPAAERWVEFAETRAIGRACAALGYGTLAALEEDSDPADAPVESRRAEKAQEPRNGREATPNTSKPTNAASEAAGVASDSATIPQQSQIRNLIGGSGMTMDELLDQLNITSLGDLTAERARKVIDRLIQLGKDRQARAAQAAPDPNAPVANTPRLQAVR